MIIKTYFQNGNNLSIQDTRTLEAPLTTLHELEKRVQETYQINKPVRFYFQNQELQEPLFAKLQEDKDLKVIHITFHTILRSCLKKKEAPSSPKRVQFTMPNELKLESSSGELKTRPNDPFTYTWKVKIQGNEPLPAGCYLVFEEDDDEYIDRLAVDPDEPNYFALGNETIEPSGTLDISIPLKAPALNGQYSGRWKLIVPSGKQLGRDLIVTIFVNEHKG